MLNLKSIFLIESEQVGSVPEILLNNPKYKKYYDIMMDAYERGAIRNQDYKDVYSIISGAKEEDLAAIGKEILSTFGFREKREREGAEADKYIGNDHDKRQWVVFHGDEFMQELYDHLGWSQSELKKMNAFRELQFGSVTEKRLKIILKQSDVDGDTKSSVEKGLMKINQWQPIMELLKSLKEKIVKRGQEGFDDVKKQKDIQSEIRSLLYYVGESHSRYGNDSTRRDASRAATEVVKSAFDQGIRKLEDILELVRSNPKYIKQAEWIVKDAYEKYAIKHGISDTMSEEQMEKIVEEFDQTFEEDVQKMKDDYRKSFEKDWISWTQWKMDNRNNPEYRNQDGSLSIALFYRWVNPRYPIGTFERGSEDFERQERVKRIANNLFFSDYISLRESVARKKLEDDLVLIAEANKAKLHENIYKHLRNLDIKSVEKLYLRRGAKGFEGSFEIKLVDGSVRIFRTMAFSAGGYNIQAFHYRYKSSLE